MEEFQEADVMWPQADDDDDHAFDCFSEEHDNELDSSEGSDESASPASSSAIDMFPRRRKRGGGNPWTPNDSDDGDDEEEEEDIVGGERVPPHVLVKRRMSTMYSTSGSGALKGRHLRQLRNSVLRMTGFLET